MSAAVAEPPAKRLAAGNGAAAKPPELEFFSAWFCPYAQRAWIALEHHGLPYKKVEGLLPDKPGEQFVGYIKNPRLLELNPKGMVPTISEGPGSPPVYESLVCVEYVDEVAGAGAAGSLLPGRACERAQLRVQADWVNRECCSPFYQVLVRKDQAERKAAFAALVAGIDALEAKLASSPYLAGDSLTIVDLAYIPWAHRVLVCKVVETYRGPDFAVDMARRPRLAAWMARVFALPAVKVTLAQPEELLATYKRYADGTAQSQVAEAVRQGRAAHTA